MAERVLFLVLLQVEAPSQDLEAVQVVALRVAQVIMRVVD